MAEVRMLPTPLGRRVKVIEEGAGEPVVFLHSGVGSAGEWKQVFALWRDGGRLLAIDAYGAGPLEQPTIDDYADQVYALGERMTLVGFSWGGATALRVASQRPDLVESLVLVEPEPYAVLRGADDDAYAQICALRDRWRAHVGDGRWDAAFEEFIDFYNGRGSFAGWPAERRDAFLAVQRTRGDLWDVLFDDERLGTASLGALTMPVHVVEGSATSPVDRAICTVVRRHVPHARHTVIDGAAHMLPLTHAEALTTALRASAPPS